MRVTMLGCGPSWGVPRIGNDWGACDPKNPKNRRTRCALLIEDGGHTILIDTPPDLRHQLLTAQIKRIDAVLFTHAHADHSHGIDDLRSVNRLVGKPLPIYTDPHTMSELQARFRYIFTPVDTAAPTFYKPAIEPHEIDGPFTAAGMAIVPFEQDHGFSKTTGLPVWPGRIFDRRDDARRCGVRGAGRRRALGRRLHPPCAASDAQPSRADAWLDRAREAAARDPDAYGRNASITRHCARRCRRASSRAMMGW